MEDTRRFASYISICKTVNSNTINGLQDIFCINQMSSTTLTTPQNETTLNQPAIPKLTAEITTILITSQTQSSAYQADASELQSNTSLVLSTTNQTSSNIPETSSKTTLSVDQTTIISNTSSTITSQLPGSESNLYSLSKYIQI